MQPSGLLRNMRNVVHNYTEVEIKVREATSNDPWGPSSSIMAEISDLTYQAQPFPEIMNMLWKRLSDHGKNWRHVYKSLMLLDYLVKTGSERVAAQCKENIYAITTLKDFQFIDRDGKDQGTNVRERAKQLVSLLQDEDRLRGEREKGLKNKERFSKATTGIGSHSGSQIGYTATGVGTSTGLGASSARDAIRSSGEEELQLQLALAMSKEEADEAEKARREDQVRVELAIKESLKENDNKVQPAQPPPPKNNIDDLLNLDLAPVAAAPVTAAPSQPANAFNPWGENSANAAPSADPFGDPWGAPSQPAADSSQWAQPPPPAPSASADPWGSSAPTPQPDPFGTSSFPTQDTSPFAAPAKAFAAPIAANTTSDPFGAPPSAQNDPFGSSDPFSSNTTSTPAQPTGINNNPSADLFSLPPSNAETRSPFDLDSIGGSLPQTTQPQDKKTAQTFLGSAAGLVNLDNLVQRPKQPAATNPFGMSSMTNPMTNNSAKSNPFHNTSPGPSMHELQQKTHSQMSGLQQPMAPSPVGGANPAMSPFGASSPGPTPQNMYGVQPMSQNMFGQPQGMTSSNSFGQNGQKSNNPFL